MKTSNWFLILLVGLAMIGTVNADERQHPKRHDDCQHERRPVISFIEFKSWRGPAAVTGEITVKGKLMVPVEWNHGKGCFFPKSDAAAVLILHGSAGVDSRGDFYARALNIAGIATLEIDMWEARGVAGVADRPPHPIYTYRDAFAALKFLSKHPGIDRQRIGVMGFSWGGVVTMASATTNMEALFSLGGARFKAHLAHYPICYAYNSVIQNSEFGSHKGNPLTGAPILVQIGELDDYDQPAAGDQGAKPCKALKNSLDNNNNPNEKGVLNIVTYENATHAWDRLQVPLIARDPFAHLGSSQNPDGNGNDEVRIVPDVEQAYASRAVAVQFFRRNL